MWARASMSAATSALAALDALSASADIQDEPVVTVERVSDAGAEPWQLVDDFKHLEMRSKYFKDDFEHVRYDDGTVGGPVLESNTEMVLVHPEPKPSVAPPRLHLVLDTETSGLYEPHVVQLAYIVFTDDGTEVTRYNKILKLLPGKRIDPRAVEVHKITMSRVQRDGVQPVKELNDFVRVCADCITSGGKVIAHNAQFDVRAINITLSAWEPAPTLMDGASIFCTMKATKMYSPLTDRAGRRKAFKNEELHVHLFGKEPDLGPLHDALTDILVTKANFLECAKRKWF